MKYTFGAYTNIGTTRKTNQDSLLIKKAKSPKGEILLAVICDGMGGLSKGELASATMIRRFDEWFDAELELFLSDPGFDRIAGRWQYLINEINNKFVQVGLETGERLGTTFTGILFVGNKMLIEHVGDTRAYFTGDSFCQLTEDQTFINQEIKAGRLTLEEAMVHPKRNALTQCVGASINVVPQIITLDVLPGTYMLCSDGFRHTIVDSELNGAMQSIKGKNGNEIDMLCRQMTEQAMARGEKDNITVAMIEATKNITFGGGAFKIIDGLKFTHTEETIVLD